nr:G-type lectin S-receptor-like serine/threonine-protein kinase At4g27290 [Tanacetum cinerariifolium]
DYPGNTFLPGIKFGKNFITGKERYMRSCRSRDDPSPGEYTMRWKMDEYPQVCNILTSPYCGCLEGFKPAAGSRVDEWSSGCQRMVALDCKRAEGFLKYPGVKLPDTKARNGCLRWFDNLIDVRVYPQKGQDLYIKMAASEVLRLQSGPNKKKQLQLEVFLSISAVMIILSMILALYLWINWKRSNVNSDGSEAKLLDTDHEGSIEMGEIHLPLFGLSAIAKATNNFSLT